MKYIFLVLGFILLIKGADYFVEGSSNIARFFKIPSVVIGLTLVAIGTSLPEAAVSITAAIKHSSDLSISNIVGSNLFNLFFILGFTSLFKPIITSKDVVSKDYNVSFLASLLLLVCILGSYFIYNNLSLNRSSGFIFLIFFIIYITILIKKANKEGDNSYKKLGIKDVLLVVIGIGMIILGGEFTVNSSILIARCLGLSERVIGLTVVAMGTSLPELCTSLVALLKKENDIAIGNVIGSNIFNILFILGISSLIEPMRLNSKVLIDIMLLTIGSLLVGKIILKDYKISKGEGVVMIIFYIIYLFYVIGR